MALQKRPEVQTLTDKQKVQLLNPNPTDKQHQTIEMTFNATNEHGDEKEITVQISVPELFCLTEEGQRWIKNQPEAYQTSQPMRKAG